MTDEKSEEPLLEQPDASIEDLGPDPEDEATARGGGLTRGAIRGESQTGGHTNEIDVIP